MSFFGEVVRIYKILQVLTCVYRTAWSNDLLALAQCIVKFFSTDPRWKNTRDFTVERVPVGVVVSSLIVWIGVSLRCGSSAGHDESCMAGFEKFRDKALNILCG